MFIYIVNWKYIIFFKKFTPYLLNIFKKIKYEDVIKCVDILSDYSSLVGKHIFIKYFLLCLRHFDIINKILANKQTKLTLNHSVLKTQSCLINTTKAVKLINLLTFSCIKLE